MERRAMKKALIPGCTGQDGRYLTEFLLAGPSKGWWSTGWEPTVASRDVVRIMIKFELAAVERSIAGGFDSLNESSTFGKGLE